MIYRITMLAISIMISCQMMGQQASKMIALSDIEGKWFITYSNFPMWLKGNKTLPTFNYTLVNKKKGAFLLDKVEYLKKGKLKSINGIDTPLNSDNSSFVWRGNGLLKILKSKWQILHLDTDDNWAIIFFEKTLFTPKGYDVIARTSTLTEAQKQVIQEKLNALGIKEKLTVIKQ